MTIQKKTITAFVLFLFFFTSCQTTFTKEEKKLINSADVDIPFQVLLTANKEDSLFLRKKSADIKSIKNNPDLQLLIARLHATLKAENGVGIAAPQIGIARNVFLFMRIDKPEYPVEVVINPKITAHSDETICFEGDGCLSILNISGDSRRYKWIEVEYYNEYGEKIKERLEGHSRLSDFTGIIFQHEYAHLQGALFIDELCEK
ncbi:MAG: peptide deformylase [Bacteroidales bacterium]|jgi:peptide deformylase|nr:peptide deformylase [Bacteroidales bacterium]